MVEIEHLISSNENFTFKPSIDQFMIINTIPTKPNHSILILHTNSVRSTLFWFIQDIVAKTVLTSEVVFDNQMSM